MFSRCWKSTKIKSSSTEECCICYTESDDYNKCKHCTNTNVCLLCYNDIKNTDNYRCPVCRAENWVKGEDDIESQTSQTPQRNVNLNINTENISIREEINNIEREREISISELYSVLNFYNKPRRCISFNCYKTMLAIRNLILNAILLCIVILMFGLFSYVFDITIKIGGLFLSIFLTGYIFMCIAFCCCGSCVGDVSCVKDLFLPVKC